MWSLHNFLPLPPYILTLLKGWSSPHAAINQELFQQALYMSCMLLQDISTCSDVGSFTGCKVDICSDAVPHELHGEIPASMTGETSSAPSLTMVFLHCFHSFCPSFSAYLTIFFLCLYTFSKSCHQLGWKVQLCPQWLIWVCGNLTSAEHCRYCDGLCVNESCVYTLVLFVLYCICIICTCIICIVYALILFVVIVILRAFVRGCLLFLFIIDFLFSVNYMRVWINKGSHNALP